MRYFMDETLECLGGAASRGNVTFSAPEQRMRKIVAALPFPLKKEKNK